MEASTPTPGLSGSSFTDGENWTGGFYELAILLGPSDDDRLDAALRAVWADPRLTGCYADRHREPQQQPVVEPSASSLRASGYLRGLAVLPSGAVIVCGVSVVREEDPALDWIVFYLPLGALSRVDPRVGGFPFGSQDSLGWRRAIDEWLGALATRVFSAVPFDYALIGFEVSGEPKPPEVAVERYFGVLVPSRDHLEYIPANR